MTAIVITVPASAPEIMERIKELKQHAHRNESETARLNIELGVRFAQLKVAAAGTWQAKLQRLGYSARVVSRLMKAAKTVAAPDGTVSPKLLERLPGDPIKLETLAALPLADVQRLIGEHNVRQMDRNEVVALVRQRQGKKRIGNDKALSATENIRQAWAQSVEGLLKKISSIKAPTEKEALIGFLDESLNDLRESLHQVEEEAEQEESGEIAATEDAVQK